jgi:choice-of-anchor B domain-containing protein
MLESIDHNQYIKGDYVYQANYTSGLRILNLNNIAEGTLEEDAYFDTFPAGNRVEYNGAWSNYPYFESGVVIVSDVTNGLFILRPNLE